MPPVTFDDDPDLPAAAVPTAPGVPRITVTPGAPPPGPVTFDDDPDLPAPRPGRPGDRTRELISEQSKMSWPAWLNQGAGDFLASGADMTSFGMRPRLDAATGAVTGTYPDYSTGLAAELEQNRVRAERSPIATLGGNIAGGIAGGVVGAVPRIGAKIAGKLGGGGLARTLGFGTEAGGVGAAQAAGHTYSGNFEDYWKNATSAFPVGAVIGGAAGGLVPKSAVTMRPGDPRTGQAIPVAPQEKLAKIVDADYNYVRGLPATYSYKGFNAHLDAAVRDMRSNAALPSTAKPVYDVIDQLRKGEFGFANAAGDIGPVQIDLARRAINNLRNTTDASAKAGTGARILRGVLDDFIQNPGANVTGSQIAAQKAAAGIERARGNAAALFRSKTLTDPLENAQLAQRTGGALTGDQLVNKGRQILATKMAEQPKTRGWNAAEKARLEEAITPTPLERAANVVAGSKGHIPAFLGGLLGAGGGGVGGAAGGAPGMIGGATTGGAAGVAAGYAANAAAARAARGFSAGGIQDRWTAAAEAMRARSPYHQQAIRGSVPVAGPGMGPKLQGVTSASTAELGTPYDDGRAALVPSMMQQFGFY